LQEPSAAVPNPQYSEEVVVVVAGSTVTEVVVLTVVNGRAKAPEARAARTRVIEACIVDGFVECFAQG
jgi:spore maturation protein SpmB